MGSSPSSRRRPWTGSARSTSTPSRTRRFFEFKLNTIYSGCNDPFNPDPAQPNLTLPLRLNVRRLSLRRQCRRQTQLPCLARESSSATLAWCVIPTYPHLLKLMLNLKNLLPGSDIGASCLDGSTASTRPSSNSSECPSATTCCQCCPR